VLICGKRVVLLDALWLKFEQERFSASADFATELTLDSVGRDCGSGGAGRLELRPLSWLETAAVDAETRGGAAGNINSTALVEARGNLKFKLTHVTLCRF